MAETKEYQTEPHWERYLRVKHHQLAERSRVVQRYLPWCYSIANAAHAKMPKRIKREDVGSEAVYGMLQSIDRYDGSGPFEAFARPRVVGAIQDWARKNLRHPEFSLTDLMTSCDGET